MRFRKDVSALQRKILGHSPDTFPSSYLLFLYRTQLKFVGINEETRFLLDIMCTFNSVVPMSNISQTLSYNILSVEMIHSF